MTGWRPLAVLAALFRSVAWGAPPAADADRVARIDALYETYRAAFADVPEVRAEELMAWVAADAVVIVDVRPAVERDVAMIPGAIPAERFDAAAAAGKPVVAYCTIGARSGAWVAEQRKLGVDARNLRGSVLSWSHAGGAFVDASGAATRRVHVYGPTWDLLRADYTAVY